MESNSDVKKNSITSTYSPASEDSLSQQIESSETSSTFSATSNRSPKQSSESTGRKPRSFLTSEDLLLTPSVTNIEGGETRYEKRKAYRESVGRHWTAGNLAEQLKFSQVASPANPSPKLDEDEARRTTATSGLRCYESYESFIRAGSSVKMLAGLLLGTKAWFSNKCILTWKVKVTKSKRLLFQLYPSTRRTEEIEFGLLLTPRVAEITETQENFAKRMNSKRKNDRKNGHANLSSQIASMLPTPRVSMKNDGIVDRGKHNLGEVTGGKTGLKLQPAFVEWMMGFPEGWTEIPDSKLLEMRLSRKLQKK